MLKHKERLFANKVKSLPVEHPLSWAWRLMSSLTSLIELFYSLQTFTGPLMAEVIYCLRAALNLVKVDLNVMNQK